jgi:hypothetical protein
LPQLRTTILHLRMEEAMRRVFLILVLPAIAIGAIAGPAAAQANVPGGIGVGASLHIERVPPNVNPIGRSLGSSDWSAKFLCGEIPPSGSAEQGKPLAPGSYRTTINIFNGQTLNPAAFQVNVLLAQAPGMPYVRSGTSLTVDSFQAVSLDCDNIRAIFGGPLAGFLEGFVRASVRRGADGDASRIEVIAVYTMKNVEGSPAQPPNQ